MASPAPSSNFASISRAQAFFCCRAGAQFLLISISGSRSAFQGFSNSFIGMLGNKPLPMITQFIIAHPPPAKFFPWRSRHAVAAARYCSAVRAIYLCGSIIMAIFLQGVLMWIALFSPIGSIIHGMSESQ